MAQKYYVVWSGRRTGIFTDWATTQQAVDKYPGACFKSFPTRAEAERAFGGGEAGAGPGKEPGLPAADGPAPSKAAVVAKPRASRGQRRGTHISHQFDVSIYCDGACDPNPGHAGSGIVLYRAGKLAELWFGLYNPRGTNNSAELNALYHALRMAEAEIETGNSVQVCSDSAYSINCIRTWAPNWEKRGWKRADGEIRNLEIIQDCYTIYRRIRTGLNFIHVAAHVGTEGNELADRMALLGAQRKERELRPYDGPIDIPMLLKLRR